MSEPPSGDTEPDRKLAVNFFGVLVRPARTLRALGESKSSRAGLSAIALLGIFWSVFCALLFLGGHQPSFVLVPIPRDLYYAAQALLMTPVLSALFWIHSELAHRLSARDGTESGARTAIGFAYGAPMLIAHVAPETIAYLAGGFETMALVGRFSLPVAALWVWALSAAALRIVHGVGWPRAIGASFAGLVLQALAGALIIR
jgi:hypothetical protein